ncbi:MAG: sulfite exporter TauE/SafE family protein [Hyphomicrobiales bacterium]|nr:sulfite exporter TauE/SafE family protein [Hyphomicrobiales bacterium]
MIDELFRAAFAEFSTVTLILVVLVTLASSAIHGATGVAGGLLLTAALAPIIGVKPIVPMLSIALLISHGARALLNVKEFNRAAYLAVTLPAIPCIIAGALVYGRLTSAVIAILLAAVILVSIPIRRWAQSRAIKANAATLGGIGAVYGGLSGATIGPGLLLIPFLLGYGLSKGAFVATLAVIALTTNVVRLTVFGGTRLLEPHLILLGVLVGLLTIPGNWIGRSFLRRMSLEFHVGLVDILTVIGALNFVWLAYKNW